jgi:hypothetical protein
MDISLNRRSQLSAERTAYEVIPYAIEKLQNAGYQLVTLAECLGEQPYQSVGAPSARDVRLFFLHFPSSSANFVLTLVDLDLLSVLQVRLKYLYWAFNSCCLICSVVDIWALSYAYHSHLC